MRYIEITPVDNIQTNVDAIAAEGGGLLVLTPGVYVERNTINLPECVEIKALTNQCHVHPEKAQVRINHEPIVPADLFFCSARNPGSISGLCCVGNANSKAAFRFESSSTFNLINNACHQFKNGVVLQACMVVSLDGMYIECRFVQDSVPVHIIGGPAPTTTLTLHRCRLRRGEVAILTNDNSLNDLLIQSPIIESCLRGAYKFGNGGTVRIIGQYLEQVGYPVISYNDSTQVFIS